MSSLSGFLARIIFTVWVNTVNTIMFSYNKENKFISQKFEFEEKKNVK
jgi:hypothetical protein